MHALFLDDQVGERLALLRGEGADLRLIKLALRRGRVQRLAVLGQLADGVQFSKVGQAAFSICRERSCHMPLKRSARKRAICAAPFSAQRIPGSFNLAPVT